MKRILACVPTASDGCAFYRGIGVLGELRRHGIDVQVMSHSASWTDMSTCDIGFMQRPYKAVHLEIAKMIKDQGPLWIDYDDNVLAVPMNNDAYSTYMTPETLKIIQQLLAMADVVTVSTYALQEALSAYNHNVRIIRNAYNDYRLDTNEISAREKVILWRGTTTHANDLLYYKKAFESLFEAFSDYKFIFVGMAPWMLDTRNADVAFINPQSLFQYFKTVDKVAASYVLVPLIDDELNRSKSNIAWIETMRSNSLVVAPDYGEWLQGGVNNYEAGNVESFLDVCATTLQSNTIRSTHLYNVTRDFLLSDVNQERVKLVNEYT